MTLSYFLQESIFNGFICCKSEFVYVEYFRNLAKKHLKSRLPQQYFSRFASHLTVKQRSNWNLIIKIQSKLMSFKNVYTYCT